jgi:hypothetical protein
LSSTFYPIFVPAVGSSQTIFADDPNLRYIPASGTLFANALTAAGNITTTGLMSAAGNVLAGNLITTGSGGNITGADLISSIRMSASGNVVAGSFYTVGLISATGNITGAGIAGTSLTVNAGNITVGNIVNSGGNGTGNIGSAFNYFNTVFAKATSAQYADLAEIYSADSNYSPGTVVIFGGNYEITTTTQRADSRVAGAVSTQPAYLMNSDGVGLPIALRGKIPVNVIGPVHKGDSLITSTQSGLAESIGTDTSYGQAVFAKSLVTDLDPGSKTIMAVIL